MPSLHEKICFILLPGFSPDFVPVHALKRALEIRGYVAIESNFFGDVVIDDFQKLTIVECQKNISNLINQMASEYDYVIGIGVSLGGALLIEHAKNNDNLYGVISIGTPFKLKYRKLMNIGEFILPIIYPIWKQFERLKHLRLLPIGAGPTIIRYLESKFLQKLESVHTPILFLHSKKDLVTDYKALPSFSEKISSTHKKIILTENGNHVIDNDPNFIIEQAINFFNLPK